MMASSVYLLGVFNLKGVQGVRKDGADVGSVADKLTKNCEKVSHWLDVCCLTLETK